MEQSGLNSVINEFPHQIQMPMRHVLEWGQVEWVLRKEFSEWKLNLTKIQTHTDQKVRRLDETLERLATTQERTDQKFQSLAEAQEHTDQKVSRLDEALERLATSQESLAEAQKRTEKQFQSLAEAQERTDQKVSRLDEALESLAAAQERTEKQVQRLAKALERTDQRVQNLEEALERTDQRVQSLAEAQKDGFKSLSDQITALGGRWGIYNEGTFRSTIKRLMRDVEGTVVEEGFYGGRQVDVIIRNGEHVMLEITSRMHSKDIAKLYGSADDYRDRTGVEPKLMVATSYVAPSLMRKLMKLERPIEIFSYDPEE